MSKIGILTFHRSINYGAYMQCLALSHEISVRFPSHSVEVVDYNSLIIENNYRVRFNKSMLRRPKELIYKIKRKKVFRDSLKYLPLSPERIFDNECDRVFEYIKGRYDIIVVGSDAVWNWIKRGFPNPYLLNIGKGICKLSYAASAFGMGMEYVTSERKEIFGKSLKDFDFIGVRDEYTDSLVRYCAPEVKTEFTCDPTAFLDLQYVMKLLNTDIDKFRRDIYTRYNIPKEKRIIGVMGTNRILVKKLREKYKDTHVIVSVFSSTGAEDIFMYDIEPLEWSLLFSLFDITLTNFFHGTMLSLRNSTPVISIDHTKFGIDYKGKMQDVLCRMELDDCFFRLNEAISDGWKKVIEKTDELINDNSIRKKIDNNREKLIVSSDNFFQALASAIEKSGNIPAIPHTDCTGCMLCQAKCPKSAISVHGIKGFLYPKIDNEKCIKCGLCEEICPLNRDRKSNLPLSVWAACDNNTNNRKAASSGGIFGLLARKVIADGGVVSGVAYNSELNAVHKIARTVEELSLFCGSKYLQSKTDNIFKDIETELKLGKKVLASGTPCQISAIKEYFGDKYDNLFLCDLICHGVQSPVVFKDYVKQLESKYSKKIVDFKFRDKTNGWKKSNVKVFFNDGSELVMTRGECEYFNYFDYLRESCYKCSFRDFKNSSDITLGDYWGIETLTDGFSDDQGVSIVICNTKKGQELFDLIRDDAKVFESNLEHALLTHKKLKKSVAKPPHRDGFFNVLSVGTYNKARRFYYNKTRLYRIKQKIKRIL